MKSLKLDIKDIKIRNDFHFFYIQVNNDIMIQLGYINENVSSSGNATKVRMVRAKDGLGPAGESSDSA